MLGTGRTVEESRFGVVFVGSGSAQGQVGQDPAPGSVRLLNVVPSIRVAVNRQPLSVPDLPGDAEVQPGAAPDVEPGRIDGDVLRCLARMAVARPPAGFIDHHVAAGNPVVVGAAGLEVVRAAGEHHRKADRQGRDDRAEGGADRDQAGRARPEEAAVAIIVVVLIDPDMFMTTVMFSRGPIRGLFDGARGAFFPPLGRVVPAVGPGFAGQGGGGEQTAYQKRCDISGFFHSDLLRGFKTAFCFPLCLGK